MYGKSTEYADYYIWRLCNQILNAVKREAGKPIRPASDNPFKKPSK